MLPFYQSNVTQNLNLKVDRRLRFHQTRVAGLLTDRHRRLVEEQLALVVHEPAPVRPLLYFEIPAWSIIHLIERRIAPEALEPRPSFSLRGNPEQRRLRVRYSSIDRFVDVPRLLVISGYGRRLPLMCSLNGFPPQRYTTITSTTSTTSRFFGTFEIIRTPFLRMGPVHGPQLQPF